jgi:two-component system chemotaxis sensor kinase CheA
VSQREPAARLLRTFLDELDERRADLERDLLALERERDPAERTRRIAAMFRAVHSLKGAAHAVGIAPLEALCHDLESRLAAVREGRGELDAELIQLLLVATDAMADTGRRLRAGESLDAAHLAAPPSIPEGETTTVAGGSEESVRLGSETLDAILARWSEATVERRRLGAGLAALEDVEDFIADWRAEWRRQRPRLRGTGAEGAAVTKRLDDRLNAVATLVADRTGAAMEASRGLDRVSGALDGHLRGARMQLFAEACAGLERVVRDLALAQEKVVRLDVVGGDVALDRAVISRLRDVLRHLVRNAVDHGVELPATRLAAGKPAEATVRVSASVAGDRVIVTVSDDGAGFDEEAIRGQAAGRGLPVPRDRDELARVVLTPGFSTRSAVTTVSGRGIGLDVVRTAVEALHGAIEISWDPGRGSRCALRVPLFLATTHVVLVRAGGATFALAASDLRGTLRVKRGDLRRLEGRAVMVRNGERPLPIVSLASILGLPAPGASEREVVPAVSLSAAAGEVAFTVDDALAESEVVVTGLGRRLHAVPLVSGAAVLESGEVALLLRSSALVRAALAARGPADAATERTAPTATRHRVLVIDDSATTRSLVRSILESAGYDVAVAVDGAEAWAKLQQTLPDLVVSDVDMPRMDGFALCEAVRRSPRTRDLPIVLVTALGSDRDRARGMDVGADAYVTKAEFDQGTLLETLERLLA